ncbi:MAG: cyclic nucleotide-binding domain-containing protein, partial [Pseudomonadota bacterium]
MALSPDLSHFLASVHPYDSLPASELAALSKVCEARDYARGETVFAIGDDVAGLYVITEGEVEVTDEADVQLSILGPRNSFGERALLRDGRASRTATVTQPTQAILVPSETFHGLIKAHDAVRRFFDRRRAARPERTDLATLPVGRVMTGAPVTCAPGDT